jgi:hypothetical protein
VFETGEVLAAPQPFADDGPVTEARPGGRQRIDRVLAPGYLDGIAERPLAEVRELRNDAAQEETDLSFVRRLLHGRIDIVLAEQRRRAERRPAHKSASIVEDLATILADNAVGPASGLGRHQPLEPSSADSHRRYVEALVADVDLSDVRALTDEQLDLALEAYRTEEAVISQRRRKVQAVVDVLNSEIAARYRAGTASADDLLARELLDAGKADKPKDQT